MASDPTFYNYGLVLKALNRPDEALQRFNEALAVNPELPLLKGNLLHQKTLACDWSSSAALIGDIEVDLVAGNSRRSRSSGRGSRSLSAVCNSAPN